MSKQSHFPCCIYCWTEPRAPLAPLNTNKIFQIKRAEIKSHIRSWTSSHFKSSCKKKTDDCVALIYTDISCNHLGLITNQQRNGGSVSLSVGLAV